MRWGLGRKTRDWQQSRSLVQLPSTRAYAMDAADITRLLKRTERSAQSPSRNPPDGRYMGATISRVRAEPTRRETENRNAKDYPHYCRLRTDRRYIGSVRLGGAASSLHVVDL